MKFGWAIERLKAGEHVTRTGWNGKGMYLEYVPDDPDERMDPYLLMHTVSGTTVPWLASQTDMLSDDWETVSNSIWKVGEKVHVKSFKNNTYTILALYTGPTYEMAWCINNLETASTPFTMSTSSFIKIW
jgi:hypothetical protein